MNNSENNAVPLRTRLKQLRSAQNPVDRNRGALLIRGRLFTWLATTRTRLLEAGKPAPQSISAFWSTDEEPSLQPLLQQWVEEEGYRVSLPVVTADNAPLQFKLWTPDTAMQERSEEHTSELQSLMRISYAVFCLKKKKYTTKHTHY